MLFVYTVVTSLNQFERECDRVCLVFSSVYFSTIAMDFFFFKNKGAVKIFNFPLSVFIILHIQ